MNIGDQVFRQRTGEPVGVVTGVDREFCFAGQHWWHRDTITRDRKVRKAGRQDANDNEKT